MGYGNRKIFRGERSLEITEIIAKKYIKIPEKYHNSKSLLWKLAGRLYRKNTRVIYKHFDMFSTTITPKTKNNELMRNTMEKSSHSIREPSGEVIENGYIYEFDGIVETFIRYRDKGVKIANPTICILKKVKTSWDLGFGIVKEINEPLTVAENNLIILCRVEGIPCNIYCVGNREEDRNRVVICKAKIFMGFRDYWREVYKGKYGQKAMGGCSVREVLCDKCGYPVVMNYNFDAGACMNCNEWFEKCCGDPDCCFCGGRPLTPR